MVSLLGIVTSILVYHINTKLLMLSIMTAKVFHRRKNIYPMNNDLMLSFLS